VRVACHGGVSSPHTKTVVAQPSTESRVTSLALSLAVTRPTCFRLASRFPTSSVESLTETITSLSRSLSLPMEEMALLASKDANWMTTDSEELRKRIMVMRQIFGGMTNAECAQRLVSSPSLMSTPSATLQAQFEDLVQCLGVQPQHLGLLVQQQPYILTTPSHKVLDRFQSLSQLLHLTIPQAVGLLAAYPPLVVDEPSKLRERLEQLTCLFNCDTQQVVDMVMRFPPILLTHPEITASRATLLADNLFVQDTGALMQVVMRAPSLFTVPQNVLVAQFQKLFAIFSDQSKEEVLSIIVSNPRLLGIEGLSL